MNKAGHSGAEEVVCPNCGFHASRNYCAQCGQELHLHEDTFWGMVMHFVAHYFHYDSKFWKTLKTLWFRPGVLTQAYMRKQRMRFIPPISLYIFISAVFFLLLFTLKKDNVSSDSSAFHSFQNGIDSVGQTRELDVPGGQITIKDTQQDSSFLDRQLRKIEHKHGDEAGRYIVEKVTHNFPKLFFFLIPVVAFFLRVIFFRRRNTHFVHHAVFSLHIHSFFFSILLIGLVNPFGGFVHSAIRLLILIAGPLYCMLAIRRFYEVGYAKAIFCTLIIGVGYILSFALAVVATFFFVLAYG